MNHTFFRIVGGGGGIQTGSNRHVGHWMAYCTCLGWLWWWRIWWNEDWQGKPKYSKKTCPSTTLSTTNPTWKTRARTRAAAVGSQRLTAWAMARPNEPHMQLAISAWCPSPSYNCLVRPSWYRNRLQAHNQILIYVKCWQVIVILRWHLLRVDRGSVFCQKS
jgi:hypothetical protein